MALYQNNSFNQYAQQSQQPLPQYQAPQQEETFLQRQKRKYPKQQQSTGPDVEKNAKYNGPSRAVQSVNPSASPVMPNGQINPNPVPVTVPKSYVDPNRKGTLQEAQSGLQNWANQNLNNHQISADDYTQIGQKVGYQQGQQVTGQQYNSAMDWLASKYGQPAQPNTDNVITPLNLPAPDPSHPSYGMDLGNKPFTAYEGDLLDQFQAPQYGDIESQQANMIRSLLGDPSSLNDEVVAQMKQVQNDQFAQMAQQAQQERQAGAAARGVLGGGNDRRQDRRLDEALISSILGNNRALDIEKAKTDRSDLLNALGAATDFQNSALNRATQGYASQLAGQTAQAGINQARAASQQAAEALGLQRDTTQGDFDMRSVEGDRGFYLDRLANDLSNRNLNLQAELGRGGLNLDQQRLDETKNQFKQTFGLDLQKFLESQRQFNGQMGYNYANLGLQGQNQLMNFLMNGGVR